MAKKYHIGKADYKSFGIWVGSTKNYRDNFDRVFGKKKKNKATERSTNQDIVDEYNERNQCVA